MASYVSREKKTNLKKERSFSGPLCLIFSAEKSLWSKCTKDKKVKTGFESNSKFHAHEFSSPDTPQNNQTQTKLGRRKLLQQSSRETKLK